MRDIYVDGIMKVEVVGDCLRVILSRMEDGEPRATVAIIMPAHVVRAQIEIRSTKPN